MARGGRDHRLNNPVQWVVTKITSRTLRCRKPGAVCPRGIPHARVVDTP